MTEGEIEDEGFYTVEYKFRYLTNAMDFVKPLVVEGNYRLTITTKYKEYPRENSIDYISVVVEKIKE